MSTAGPDPRRIGGDGSGRRWVIVLAGGSGRRLGDMSTDAAGRHVPKQYCSLRGDRSLLQMTLARAARAAPSTRHVVVVDSAHEAWWSRELAALPPENVVVQPADRGTAVGLFLPLTRIYRQDPDAKVIVLPSDHYFTREDLLLKGLEEACRETRGRRGQIVLLGVKPSRPDSGLGWIEVGAATRGRTRSVAAFHEKPDEKTARALLDGGALVSSLILVARVLDLLAFFDRHSTLPQQFQDLLEGREVSGEEMERRYGGIPSLDLSRDLLQMAADDLRVLPLRDCGWVDLGTARGVRECLLWNRPLELPSLTGCPAPVDLSLRQPRPRAWRLREELRDFVEML